MLINGLCSRLICLCAFFFSCSACACSMTAYAVMSELILHMQMSEWENRTSRICHLRPCVRSYAILTQKYQRSRHWFIRIPHNRSIRAEDCGTWSCLPSVFTPRPAALIYWPWETLAMQTLVSTPTHKHTHKDMYTLTRGARLVLFLCTPKQLKPENTETVLFVRVLTLHLYVLHIYRPFEIHFKCKSLSLSVNLSLSPLFVGSISERFQAMHTPSPHKSLFCDLFG